jgi:hypothetical protein
MTAEDFLGIIRGGKPRRVGRSMVMVVRGGVPESDASVRTHRWRCPLLWNNAAEAKCNAMGPEA